MPAGRPPGSRCPSCSWPSPPSWRRSARASPGRSSRSAALDAYRLDIAGSIAGIAAFSLLSFLDAKPVVWALIVALVLLLLYGTRGRPAPGRRGRRRGAAALVGIAVVQRHLVALLPHLGDAAAHGQYSVNVNGIPHQNIIPARELQKVYSQPYLDAPANPLDNVLIVGAGTGDDVANALLHGAKHIDAVEIDPAAVPARHAAEPGPPLPGSPGHRAHQRRAGLPGADAHEVRHDPVRPARLADPGGRAVLAAAGELPVHACRRCRRRRPT